MSKRVFISLLFLLFIISTFDISNVRAQNYTADSGRGASTSSKHDSEKCTNEDLGKISIFNRVAKRNVGKYNRHMKNMQNLEDGVSKVADTPARGKSYLAKMSKVYDFFMSEEYEEMETIYARCGKKIPSIDASSGPPFWASDDMFNGGSSCTRCRNKSR
ncbi:MAG: hypothetical protein KAJ29_04780 [Alphaproteobacteria bacterium]|nr:hypothetical protein [Alphaproteobacteria bacterium]